MSTPEAQEEHANTIAPISGDAPTIELVTTNNSLPVDMSGCFPVACDPCWPDTKCDPTD